MKSPVLGFLLVLVLLLPITVNADGNQCIITGNGVNIRNQPSLNGGIVGTLNGSALAHANTDGWWQIAEANWVSSTVTQATPECNGFISHTEAPPTANSQGNITVADINLNTSITTCPYLQTRNWDISRVYQQLCWLDPFAPGITGSLILAGHSTYADGSPAVLYRLSELETGDRIVVNWEGATYNFIVSSVTSISQYEVNSIVVLGALTIFTCDTNSLTDSGYERRTLVIAYPE